VTFEDLEQACDATYQNWLDDVSPRYQNIISDNRNFYDEFYFIISFYCYIGGYVDKNTDDLAAIIFPKSNVPYAQWLDAAQKGALSLKPVGSNQISVIAPYPFLAEFMKLNCTFIDSK